jgi:hypothetical protein
MPLFLYASDYIPGSEGADTHRCIDEIVAKIHCNSDAAILPTIEVDAGG